MKAAGAVKIIPAFVSRFCSTGYEIESASRAQTRAYALWANDGEPPAAGIGVMVMNMDTLRHSSVMWTLHPYPAIAAGRGIGDDANCARHSRSGAEEEGTDRQGRFVFSRTLYWNDIC